MKLFTVFLGVLLLNNFAYSQSIDNKVENNKFKTECKLLEAEISLLLFC